MIENIISSISETNMFTHGFFPGQFVMVNQQPLRKFEYKSWMHYHIFHDYLINLYSKER